MPVRRPQHPAHQLPSRCGGTAAGGDPCPAGPRDGHEPFSPFAVAGHGEGRGDSPCWRTGQVVHSPSPVQVPRESKASTAKRGMARPTCRPAQPGILLGAFRLLLPSEGNKHPCFFFRLMAGEPEHPGLPAGRYPRQSPQGSGSRGAAQGSPASPARGQGPASLSGLGASGTAPRAPGSRKAWGSSVRNPS